MISCLFQDFCNLTVASLWWISRLPSGQSNFQTSMIFVISVCGFICAVFTQFLFSIERDRVWKSSCNTSRFMGSYNFSVIFVFLAKIKLFLCSLSQIECSKQYFWVIGTFVELVYRLYGNFVIKSHQKGAYGCTMVCWVSHRRNYDGPIIELVWFCIGPNYFCLGKQFRFGRTRQFNWIKIGNNVLSLASSFRYDLVHCRRTLSDQNISVSRNPLLNSRP